MHQLCCQVCEKPTTTVDKYFVTDAVIGCSSHAGLGIIGRNVRNRVPTDIEPFYLHTNKTNTTVKHTKAGRFFDPIDAVKYVWRGLTSSCSIESANYLNECTNCVELREKYRGKHKLQCVI